MVNESQKFNITDVSFAELKVIRDACLKLGNSGIKPAIDIAKSIEEAMENITI